MAQRRSSWHPGRFATDGNLGGRSDTIATKVRSTRSVTCSEKARKWSRRRSWRRRRRRGGTRPAVVARSAGEASSLPGGTPPERGMSVPAEGCGNTVRTLQQVFDSSRRRPHLGISPGFREPTSTRPLTEEDADPPVGVFVVKLLLATGAQKIRMVDHQVGALRAADPACALSQGRMCEINPTTGGVHYHLGANAHVRPVGPSRGSPRSLLRTTPQ